MPQLSKDTEILGSRYALCVGIGTYTNLINHDLRYAVADATIIAERLADPQRGNFTVTLLAEPNSTCKAALDEAVEKLLSAPDRQAEDLIVIYFSCHGTVSTLDNTFCLLPSDAVLQAEGMLEQTTLISISDFARWLSRAKAQNIVMLLDVCHSGGAGAALHLFKMNLSTGLNYFIIGGARQDQFARGSSLLQHGFFTHCLLRAFDQPPTKDGWLTISQIHNFVSDEIPWYYKGQPIQIQGLSVSVNPNLPLLRNPCYPELSPLPPLWNVPLQQNPFFTGQEGLLSQLANMLQREQKTALTQPYAINGLGGIGKTQLALEYAYRHRQNYHAVFWGSADTYEVLISTFVTIADLLDLPQKDEQDQLIIVEAVKTWLAGRSRWLLILDNADDLTIVKEFLPPAFQGHLLITTRAQVTGSLARKIEVDVMSPETGALLLLRRAGLITPDSSLEQASLADVAVAKELSEEMGGLPLALDQAGAYIDEASCSLQDYQQLYQTRQAKLLKERGGVMPDHPESVATTWSLAFQKVEQSNPAASDLLRLCAFLHPDAIPEEMITKGAEYLGPQLQTTASDPLALNKAITALRAYSLFRRDSAMHTLAIHRLVQAVLKESMSEQTQHEWAKRTVQAVNRAFPDVIDVKLWEQCERYFPHALECERLTETYNFEFAEVTNLLNNMALYLCNRYNQYSQAEPLLKRALEMSERRLGPEHPDTGYQLGTLAQVYDRLDRYEEVEQVLKRILEMSERRLGPEHSDIARDLYNLGEVYISQGRYEEAEPLLKHALEMSERHLGPEHPEMVYQLLILARFYARQGRYEEAEPLLKRALEMSERHLGPEHPEMIYQLLALARFYARPSRYEEAEQVLKHALEMSERHLGLEHPATAESLESLGAFYIDQRRYEEAEPLLKHALEMSERHLGPEHLTTAESLENTSSLLGTLARFYARQGRYEEAELALKHALEMSERHLGLEHPATARSLQILGAFYISQGRYEEAEPLLKRALEMSERHLGPEHRATFQSLESLGVFYMDQGRYEEAEPLLKRALETSERHLGPKHLITRDLLLALTRFYDKQGRHKEAELLFILGSIDEFYRNSSSTFENEPLSL